MRGHILRFRSDESLIECRLEHELRRYFAARAQRVADAAKTCESNGRIETPRCHGVSCQSVRIAFVHSELRGEHDAEQFG
jgi:hypothetical protein